jgi:hypothetical protein
MFLHLQHLYGLLLVFSFIINPHSYSTTYSIQVRVRVSIFSLPNSYPLIAYLDSSNSKWGRGHLPFSDPFLIPVKNTIIDLLDAIQRHDFKTTFLRLDSASILK